MKLSLKVNKHNWIGRTTRIRAKKEYRMSPVIIGLKSSHQNPSTKNLRFGQICNRVLFCVFNCSILLFLLFEDDADFYVIFSNFSLIFFESPPSLPFPFLPYLFLFLFPPSLSLPFPSSVNVWLDLLFLYWFYIFGLVFKGFFFWTDINFRILLRGIDINRCVVPNISNHIFSY